MECSTTNRLLSLSIGCIGWVTTLAVSKLVAKVTTSLDSAGSGKSKRMTCPCVLAAVVM